MNSRPDDNVVSYLTLRQMIGWVGFFMPIVVRAGAWYIEGIHTSESISAYYYTGMRDVFVSTLVLVGALVMCYRTPARLDNVMATICGIAAIGIGLFPMDPAWAAELVQRFPDMASEKCYFGHGILGYHFAFVSTFFALSFYLVFFRFSAFTPASPTRQKRLRNRIYKVCGIAMLAAFLCIGYLAIMHRGASIFWPETAAVIAFAVAWLVKGQTILKDSGTPRSA
jgi:hypothetical protein